MESIALRPKQAEGEIMGYLRFSEIKAEISLMIGIVGFLIAGENKRLLFLFAIWIILAVLAVAIKHLFVRQ